MGLILLVLFVLFVLLVLLVTGVKQSKLQVLRLRLKFYNRNLSDRLYIVFYSH